MKGEKNEAHACGCFQCSGTGGFARYRLRSAEQPQRDPRVQVEAGLEQPLEGPILPLGVAAGQQLARRPPQGAAVVCKGPGAATNSPPRPLFTDESTAG